MYKNFRAPHHISSLILTTNCKTTATMRFNTPALFASAIVALSFLSFTEAKSHHKCGTMGTQRCRAYPFPSYQTLSSS
jgi:hypothetical protein